MMAIYNSIKYENVFPVIMCGDVEAKHIIGKAIKYSGSPNGGQKLDWSFSYPDNGCPRQGVMSGKLLIF